MIRETVEEEKEKLYDAFYNENFRHNKFRLTDIRNRIQNSRAEYKNLIEFSRKKRNNKDRNMYELSTTIQKNIDILNNTQQNLISNNPSDGVKRKKTVSSVFSSPRNSSPTVPTKNHRQSIMSNLQSIHNSSHTNTQIPSVPIEPSGGTKRIDKEVNTIRKNILHNEKYTRFTKSTYINTHTQHNTTSVKHTVPYFQYVLDERDDAHRRIQKEASALSSLISSTTRLNRRNLDPQRVPSNKGSSSLLNSKSKEKKQYEVLHPMNPSNQYLVLDTLDTAKGSNSIPKISVKKKNMPHNPAMSSSQYTSMIQQISSLEKSDPSSREILGSMHSAHARCKSIDTPPLDFVDIFKGELTEREPVEVMNYTNRIYKTSSIHFKKKILQMNVLVSNKSKGVISHRPSRLYYTN